MICPQVHWMRMLVTRSPSHWRVTRGSPAFPPHGTGPDGGGAGASMDCKSRVWSALGMTVTRNSLGSLETGRFDSGMNDSVRRSVMGKFGFGGNGVRERIHGFF